MATYMVIHMALRNERDKGEYIGGSDLRQYCSDVMKMPYGSERRKKLLELFEEGFELYLRSSNFDPDIKTLLKKDKVELFNKINSSKTKQTWVRIKL